MLFAFAHPGHDLPVIEADDEFHLHRDFAAHAFDDADDVRIFAARRHEIDQAHRAAFCGDLRLEDECIATVVATCLYHFFRRKKPPVTVFRVAQQRCKTRRRIEPRKTKPIHTTVAAHQRASLCIAKKCVVLDLGIFLRHVTPTPALARNRSGALR